MMSINLLFDDRNVDWYVYTFILQCFCHIVAYYCYLHSLDDNLCDNTAKRTLDYDQKEEKKDALGNTIVEGNIVAVCALFTYILWL